MCNQTKLIMAKILKQLIIYITLHRIISAQAGALSAAKSYPTSEVRDSGPECQAVMAQELPGGATPCPRSVAAGRRHLTSRSGVAGRSHLALEASGGSWEEQPEERLLRRHRRA